MLASSFFFGRGAREKREKEQRLAIKDAAALIRAFQSEFFTDEYEHWGKLS